MSQEPFSLQYVLYNIINHRQPGHRHKKEVTYETESANICQPPSANASQWRFFHKRSSILCTSCYCVVGYRDDGFLRSDYNRSRDLTRDRSKRQMEPGRSKPTPILKYQRPRPGSTGSNWPRTSRISLVSSPSSTVIFSGGSRTGPDSTAGYKVWPSRRMAPQTRYTALPAIRFFSSAI